MESPLFHASHLEVETPERFRLQNSRMLRVSLGDDVLAVKGAMVAYQGAVEFHHEGAGSVGKLIKKLVTSEDVPLMRVKGRGEVFFAKDAGEIFLVTLQGDGLSLNGPSLLAFDAALQWDIRRVQGAGMMSGGLFNTVVHGHGVVAVNSVGTPVVLDCSTQPTYVDIHACVGWSAGLTPQLVSSMNMRSMLRGGSGESFQYAFHGPGFVIVQPSEFVAGAAGHGAQGSSGGLLGGMFD